MVLAVHEAAVPQARQDLYFPVAANTALPLFGQLPYRRAMPLPRTLVPVVALLAFFLKLYSAATTMGTTDVKLFYDYGTMINKDGLAHTYETQPLFNHTPLTGLFAAAVVHMDEEAPTPTPAG